MGESSSTVSLPIQLVIAGGIAREEVLRLIKEDPAVRRAIRALCMNTERSSLLSASKQEVSYKRAAEPAHFEDGWKIYQRYQGLDCSVREQFRNIFPTDDFTAFICSGVQQDTPVEIWDAIKRSLGTAGKKDISFLMEMLAYFVGLVNRILLPAMQIEIMSTEIGEGYNGNYHSIYGTASKRQGDVAEVFLLGLMKEGTCIRKSLIRLE